MFQPQVFFEAGRARSGVALIPFFDTLKVSTLSFSTRNGNAIIKWGDGSDSSYTPTKNSTSPSPVNKTYSTAFTGDAAFIFKQGLRDVYFIKLSAYTQSSNKESKFNIIDFGVFIKQFPKIYGYSLDLDYFLVPERYSTISGNLLDVPDSLEIISIGRTQVINTDLSIDFNGIPSASKLKSIFRDAGSVNAISVFGDISKLPVTCTICSILIAKVGSAMTYTAGKVWAHNLETLSIPLPLTTTELDNLLIDLANSVTSVGAGTIALGGYRSAVSDAAVAYLQGLGRTVNIARGYKILDLPFQNNFTDFGEIGMTMVPGGTSNQPSFAISGRKAGEYCAVFNGSQSIKTTTNLPINSDKVTVAFWIKTSQTGVGVITELSTNYNNNNSFASFINSSGANKIDISDHTNSYNVGISSNNINNFTWLHVVMTIDRNLGVTQNQIYINGSLSYTQHATLLANLAGNFVNNILFIGQRAGSSLGFNGSLTRFKIYNYTFTPSEVSTLYNSEL